MAALLQRSREAGSISEAQTLNWDEANKEQISLGTLLSNQMVTKQRQGLVFLIRTKLPGQEKAAGLRSYSYRCNPFWGLPLMLKEGAGGDSHFLANGGQGHPRAEYTHECRPEGPAEAPALEGWG